MSQTHNVNQLVIALERLEKASQKIINTNGYNKEAANMKILIELIKEQGYNENSNITNG